MKKIKKNIILIIIGAIIITLPSFIAFIIGKESAGFMTIFYTIGGIVLPIIFYFLADRKPNLFKNLIIKYSDEKYISSNRKAHAMAFGVIFVLLAVLRSVNLYFLDNLFQDYLNIMFMVIIFQEILTGIISDYLFKK